jgi:hypothetical protein
MADTAVAQPDGAATTDTSSTQTADTQDTTNTTTGSDPFEVDESSFVSLTPEQRAALDPVLTKWKESAKTYTQTVAQKERAEEAKKYADHVKKAAALDRLITDQRFVKWYQETNGNGSGAGAAPKTVASAEEWAQAYQKLSEGDPGPLEQLQAKLVMSVGGPQLQAQREQMQLLRQENEMNKLWALHPDAKELDQIGREEDENAPSLLQLAAQGIVDKGGTWEQAYALAKKVAQSMENKGKRAAMGLVEGKKGSVTEGKSKTNSVKDDGVVYVDTFNEALTKNIEAQMDGSKIKYQVRQK